MNVDASTLAGLPCPQYQPKQLHPAPTITERDTPRRRHHPLLDNTAITVRRAHFNMVGVCFCCEALSVGWLCPDCTERGCA